MAGLLATSVCLSGGPHAREAWSGWKGLQRPECFPKRGVPLVCGMPALGTPGMGGVGRPMEAMRFPVRKPPCPAPSALPWFPCAFPSAKGLSCGAIPQG
jgi:hypothetical protein